MNAETVMSMITKFGLKVILACAVLFAGWVVAKWVERLLSFRLEKSEFDPTLTHFFGSLTRYSILAITGLVCLGMFGVQTTSFAALIAASGLAIGLAFQGTLSSLAAGVMLIIFRPFKVGDYISTSDASGSVEKIGLFTTSLTTLDNRLIIVPNSNVFGSKIENVTAKEIRRVDVPVGVEYSADMDETRKVLETAIKDVPGALKEPASHAYLDSLGDSSVNWIVRVWCKTEDYWNVREQTVRASKYALDKAKIGIPFPQMDIHFDDSAAEAVLAKSNGKIKSASA